MAFTTASSIVPKRKAPGTALSTGDYARLASFRYAVRSFLYFSEQAAARVGLTGQQYQALLVIRSFAESTPVSIADLADQLLIKHNSAVGLADRLVAQSLIVRARMPEDRRKVQLRLTARGEKVLAKLAAVHRRKLRSTGPNMKRMLEGMTRAWLGTN